MIFEELWHICDPEPHGGAYNMALDEVLLGEASGPLLRVYQWEKPSVSFGYFGRSAEVERLWPGHSAVRRWTGGGIVPHGEDFTYTLIVPRGEALAGERAAESYLQIHAAVIEAWGGPASELSFATRGPKVSDECFANPVPHDVLAGGIKIAGAAQRRTRHGLLHQGSIQRAGLGAEFAGRLAAALAGRVHSRAISSGEQAQAERLVIEKYGTPEWLWRR